MARVPCHLDDILTAAKAVLVAADIVTESQAFLSVGTDDPPAGPAAPPLIGLTFSAIDRRMDTLEVEEVGGDPPTVEMEMGAILWTDVLQDQDGQDTQAITDASRGLSALIGQIINALNARDLTSGATTLTWRPIIFLGVRNRGRWRGDQNWRSVQIRFNVAFSWLVSS